MIIINFFFCVEMLLLQLSAYIVGKYVVTTKYFYCIEHKIVNLVQNLTLF